MQSVGHADQQSSRLFHLTLQLCLNTQPARLAGSEQFDGESVRLRSPQEDHIMPLLVELHVLVFAPKRSPTFLILVDRKRHANDSSQRLADLTLKGAIYRNETGDCLSTGSRRLLSLD